MSHIAIVTTTEGFLPGGGLRHESSRFESLRAAQHYGWAWTNQDERIQVTFVEDSREPQIWDREVFPDES